MEPFNFIAIAPVGEAAIMSVIVIYQSSIYLIQIFSEHRNTGNRPRPREITATQEFTSIDVMGFAPEQALNPSYAAHSRPSE